VDDTVAALGGIDIVVHSAGKQQHVEDLLKLTGEQLDHPSASVGSLHNAIAHTVEAISSS
jgi:hypothetical protein